jgi:hypothetical protein
MCEASVGAVSDKAPVRTLTTPPGTSEVASTSLRVTAGSGRRCEVATTTVLPVTITGATTLTRPSSDDSCGASTATTPVGSGREKSKYGPATGLVPPTTCAILSAHPAYQTSRSTDSSTTASARRCESPSLRRTSSTNWARRPSSTSAIRYTTWPRLYGVRADQPAKALRAACTASRASLREAADAFARKRPALSSTT